jgi:hypothetical protein
MRLMPNLCNATLTVLCLAIAACGGGGFAHASSSSDTSTSSPSSTGSSGSGSQTAPRSTASPSGTTIPAATQIIDASGNVWTICAVAGGPAVEEGAACENGKFAGTSAGVKLMLYYNDVIYLGTIYDTWYSWTGGKWELTKVDPRSLSGACGTPNGMTLATGPTADLCKAGTASTVRGTGPWAWNCAGIHGGTTASCSANNGATSSKAVPSPSGTSIPSATQIIDTSGNVWTICAFPGGAAVKEGAACENGNFAGASAGVTTLLYYNGVIYLGTIYKTWWSWTGGKWILTGDPR